MVKNFFVALADNGGMITTTSKHAEICKGYFRNNFAIHGFYDEERAQAFLYNHLDVIMPRGCPLPTSFPIGVVITPNWFLSNGYWTPPSKKETRDAPHCPILFFNRRD